MKAEAVSFTQGKGNQAIQIQLWHGPAAAPTQEHSSLGQDPFPLRRAWHRELALPTLVQKRLWGALLWSAAAPTPSYSQAEHSCITACRLEV